MQISLKIRTIMEKKRIVIAKKVMERTKKYLEVYKMQNPHTRTPMRDAWGYDVNSTPTEYDRVRFVRAARALKWDVCVDNGNILENGICVWTTSGR